MSICIALSIMLGRGIQTLYIGMKKKRETKQQQKREQQRLSKGLHGSARFQPSMQSGRGEYQHLGDHEHRVEESSSDHGHSHHRDGRHVRLRTMVPSQHDWLDTGGLDSLEDTLPTYDQVIAQLPAYAHTLQNSTVAPPRCRRRRDHRRPHDTLGGNRGCINESQSQTRARACTRIRIREHPESDVVDHGAVGGAVIWYDALEDRYEVITRSLAPPTEPPLPPRYMPNSCIMHG